ncbi:MAG: hypothetical protein GY754_04855 [bacterium]|nr:hypothetical protein [bacterium]
MHIFKKIFSGAGRWGRLTGLILVLFISVLSLSCGKETGRENKDPVLTVKSAAEVKDEPKEEGPLKPLTFENIRGKWRLKYGNDYGYYFRFHHNYKAMVILYLNTHALIFKGVYTIEEGNTIRINIYEMKRAKQAARLNTRSGFVKTKSSHFIFTGAIKGKGKLLAVKPKRTMIDGNTSGGYFEPLIKLKKIN